MAIRSARSQRRYDLALGAGLAVLGSLLSFYLIGFLLIAAAGWVHTRRMVVSFCPGCEPA